jgi:hypothetical protein
MKAQRLKALLLTVPDDAEILIGLKGNGTFLTDDIVLEDAPTHLGLPGAFVLTSVGLAVIPVTSFGRAQTVVTGLAVIPVTQADRVEMTPDLKDRAERAMSTLRCEVPAFEEEADVIRDLLQWRGASAVSRRDRAGADQRDADSATGGTD